MKESKTRKTSMMFDPELYRAVKIRAAEEGRSVRHVMEDACRDYLKRPAPKRVKVTF